MNIMCRYDAAMGTNVLGAMHILNFAKKCAQLQVLLHISTGQYDIYNFFCTDHL